MVSLNLGGRGFFPHSALSSPPSTYQPTPHGPSVPSLLSTPSSTMSTPFTPPQPRGIDQSLAACRETKCNGRGTCVAPSGGSTELVCDCELGYRGKSCEGTVNGALSVPLTLGVLAAIVGLLILAFIFAKMKRKQKKRHRY